METTTFPFLHGLPPEAQAAFLASLLQTTHGDGEVLFREGDPGDHMLLVLEGCIRLSRLTPSAEELRLAELGPGQVVGEMAVLSPAPRSAAAVAVGQTRVAHLSRVALLERLVLEDPPAGALLRACTRLVCRRLRSTRAKAALLRDALHGASPREVDQRLAQILGGEGGAISDRLKQWLSEH